MPSMQRLFNGKMFLYWNDYNTKAQADETCKELRRQGYHCRVVHARSYQVDGGVRNAKHGGYTKWAYMVYTRGRVTGKHLPENDL